jgi:hypothetical protein
MWDRCLVKEIFLILGKGRESPGKEENSELFGTVDSLGQPLNFMAEETSSSGASGLSQGHSQ